MKYSTIMKFMSANDSHWFPPTEGGVEQKKKQLTAVYLLKPVDSLHFLLQAVI